MPYPPKGRLMPSRKDSEVFVIGDSIKTNSLGRALSMAITSTLIGTVNVLAFDDGPQWAGAQQFGFKVRPFKRRHFAAIESEVRSAAASRRVVIWISKGTDPMPQLARRLAGITNVTLIADFDDDDVSIMQSFVSESRVNALKMNVLRRKSPQRLRRSQAKIAAIADITTFSSSGLRGVYKRRFGWLGPSAIVPHTRIETSRTELTPAADETIRLGFIGTVRRYKGADALVAILRADPSSLLITFSQNWSPPEDVSDRWITYPSNTPLGELYGKIDILLLPMDSSDAAARYQLPAKLVDAAVYGKAVAATPTEPIEEFAAAAYLPVTDWTKPRVVLEAIRTADREALGRALRSRYDLTFSPEATASQLKEILRAGHTPARRRRAE